MKRIIKYGLFNIIAFFSLANVSWAQNNLICGYVYDSLTREPLYGATVYNENLNGCITDQSGYFCLQTHGDKNKRITISYVGYETKKVDLDTVKVDFIRIFLKKGISLETVEVRHTISMIEETGSLKLSQNDIKNFPSLTGEPDVLKSFQYMAGVQMGDEGSSGLHVRGGSPDQNLYLLDGVPLYYVNHLGGFVSVFDVNTLQSAVLYKTDFPARFGGRLSSVLDVKLKDGNRTEHKHEIMLGTISSKLFSEGKLLPKNSSYIFSARRCNLDLIMRPFSYLNSGGTETNYYTFYDIIFKTTNTLNVKNKFSTLLYFGRDKLGHIYNIPQSQVNLAEYRSTGKQLWGNRIASFQWEHLLKNKIKWQSGIDYTGFFNEYFNETEISDHADISEYSDRFNNGIEDLAFRNIFHYRTSVIQFYTGLNTVFHMFNFSSVNYRHSSAFFEDEFSSRIRDNYVEINGFFDLQYKPASRLIFSPGLYYSYWPEMAIHHFDPRLSMVYKISSFMKIKSAYSVTHQFIHLLSSNESGIPFENWVPSTEDVPAEKARQFAAGFYFDNGKIEFSLEGYLKKMHNLVMYPPGTSRFLSENWSEQILKDGTGHVKGLELSFKKEFEKFTFWNNYTLSKNTRKFDNLNNGNSFPYKYDRRHEIKVGFHYKMSPKISFSSTWVYATGNPVTLATQKYPAIDFNNYDQNYPDQILIPAHYYGGINAQRMEDYHRLDAGIDINWKKDRRENVFHFGIYNAYNRMNPYYYYYETARDGSVSLKKFTLFPFLPSISYSVGF